MVSDRKIKIGLVEDNDVLRHNYEAYFNDDALFNIVFSLNDVYELQTISLNIQPDVILLDIMLPSGNSLTQLHRIKQIFPFTRIVVLSAVQEPKLTEQAILEGVNGFLLKSSSLNYIKEAILQIFDGGFPLSPLNASHILKLSKKKTLLEAYPNLTKREIELVGLLNTGMSNKMAATSLHISFFTVNSHLKNIYHKMNINSKNELISIASKYQTID
jgi:DNA-binding NarL/FixJ family response regulator